MAWLVTFDLDDTLYLERDFVRSGIEAVDAFLGEQGYPSGFGGHARRAFERGVRGNLFDVALGSMRIAADPGLVAALVSVYRSHRPRIALPDDARWCLGELARRGIPLALISDGPAATQRNKLRALGLASLFDPVVISDELPGRPHKPDPAAYRTVMAATLPGASLVYVADNPAKDFVTARELGWLTIRVRRERGLHAAVDAEPPHAAHHELRDLRGLPSLLHDAAGAPAGACDA